jgi:Zn-dependent peptidase ImmA (M78 family)
LKKLGIEAKPYYKIRQIADALLEEYRLENTIPVPIEELLDLKLGINIIPFPNLFRVHEINAFLANNLNSLYVDEHLYNNLEKPYRFTLAHEFGHIALHNELFQKNKPKNVSDWADFLNEVSEADRQLLEYQADDFAGLFLVPGKHLDEHYNAAFNENKLFLKRKFKSLPKYQFVQIIRKYLANEIAPILNVHQKVVEIRILRRSLHKNISDLYPKL